MEQGKAPQGTAVRILPQSGHRALRALSRQWPHWAIRRRRPRRAESRQRSAICGRRFANRRRRFAACDSRPVTGDSHPAASDSPKGDSRIGAGDSPRAIRAGISDSSDQSGDSAPPRADSSPDANFFRCAIPFKTRGFCNCAKFFSALRQKTLEMPHCGIICRSETGGSPAPDNT